MNIRVASRRPHASRPDNIDNFLKLVLHAALLGLVCAVLAATVNAQTPTGAPDGAHTSAPATQELSAAPAQVDVKPVAHDEEIRQRLQSVLDATEWFTAPQVEVKEGVVFLKGRAPSASLKKWAGDLAGKTQDVVAVVNRMEVSTPAIWDFAPAWSGLLVLWRDFVRSLPFLGFGLVILALSVVSAMLATRGAGALLRERIHAKLLRSVLAGGIGFLVFLFGIYVVLRVSGLTRLAMTVVGGTGLVGLAVGIAFRDITENFLASIFLSMQRPFAMGDLVEIAGVTGYVQQLNVRTTMLMTLDGNLVQIPNATVYKTNLCNFTTNANRRTDFTVGIGYDDSINEAQDIARDVLTNHPAVLKDPEPLVLAENLGNATITLRIYFWINGHEYSWLKVRSSLIRLVKRAYQEKGISMPDEAREVVFPQGVPVTMLEKKTAETSGAPITETSPSKSPDGEPEAVSTEAEAGLYSEANAIKAQAREAKPLQETENLLPSTPETVG